VLIDFVSSKLLDRLQIALVLETTAALAVEVCDVLGLASAAVFRRDGDERFIRVASRGWHDGHVHTLARGDHIAVALLAELQPMPLGDVRWPRADVPRGLEQHILAVPFVVRHELLGFVLYGGHVGGEAIDPDEQTLLVALGDAAADPYEHLEAQALVAQANELRAENAMLVREERLLRETIEALRSVTRGVES
jgi:hypothetical protein